MKNTSGRHPIASGATGMASEGHPLALVQHPQTRVARSARCYVGVDDPCLDSGESPTLKIFTFEKMQL